MHKLIYFLKYLRYYKKEKNTHHLSFFKCMKAFFHSFTPNEYYYFNFDKNNMNDYLSEFKRLYYRKVINGEDYTSVLDNKVLFKLIAKDKIKLSKMVLKKENGLYIDDENNKVSLDKVIQGLNGLYIIKPLGSGGGKGIKKISFINKKYFINDKEVKLNELKKEFEDRTSFLLETFVKQANYANKIYPNAANTIRMVTLKKENGEVILVKAMHRFGTDKSSPTDNFSRYGIACDIELNTGKLLRCTSKLTREFLINHPDTNCLIEGEIIPRWQNLTEEMVSNHKKLDFLTYVSWDILVTDDDYVIIEANASCGADVMQLEYGIKKNKDLYDLYKKIGALK